MLSTEQVRQFRDEVWDYYYAHAREMPWRDDPSPYNVLVSELMLQQTQVGRVMPKFRDFTVTFPTVVALANASLSEVLSAWSGLGYNRRAKFLHAAAGIVVRDYGGELPDTIGELIKLPGVGRNTAGAILTYAFERPVAFVETNIRTVFFHHFFADRTHVDDRELIPLVEQTLDPEHPREWYWALMDYGAHLKRVRGNNITQSKHYSRQSKFEGSRRQVRGYIIKLLAERPRTEAEVLGLSADARTREVLNDLFQEGFIEHNAGQLRLTESPKLP